MSVLPEMLVACRPRQWVKNLFVAAPLVFAKELGRADQAVRAAAAVGLFCALSSAVYLWNDIADLDKDRAHPTKRNRPIAAGRLSVNSARWGAIVLAVGGLLASLALGIDFALTALGYLGLNVAYSFRLKRVVYLDVFSIAGGFLLRVLAGGFAIHVWISPYLLVCTGLLASYLGFGKRAHELAVAGGDAKKQRSVLRHYDVKILKWTLYVVGAATLTAYVLYTLSDHTRQFFGTDRMVFTTPFPAFGIWRFYRLVTDDKVAESPTDAMLHDWPFMLNMALWGAGVLLIIYFR